MIRQGIVDQVDANIDFFRKRWDEFCAWAEACAQEWRRYENRQNGEYDRVVEEMQEVRRACKAAPDEFVLQKGTLRAKHAETHRKWQKGQKKLKDRGWVYCDGHNGVYRMVSVRSFYVPETPRNPAAILLHGLSCDDLEASKALLLECALLAVVHDTHPALEPRAPRVYEPGYEGAFDRDGFIEKLKGSLDGRERSGELARAWSRIEPYLRKPESGTTNGQGQDDGKAAWKPPATHLTATEILRTYRIPRATLQQWQNRDGVPGGTLYGNLVKSPGSAHTLYYPKEWVTKCMETWQPKKHKR